MAIPPAPGAPAGWSPPPPIWATPTAPPVADTRAADLAGLSHIWRAALIAIVGSVLGIAVPLVLSSAGYLDLVVPSAGSAITINSTALYLILGISVAGLAISMVSFWFYREGFVALRTVDTRFSSSPTWAVLVIVGLLIVVLGLGIVLAALLQLLTCAAGDTTSIPPSCINSGPLLGGAGLLLLGIIILLIGYIGLLVAIWRLGTRYDDSLFKIGAVLLIIPYISFVGQILILVAAGRSKTRVQQRAPFVMAPSVPLYPPPPLR